ncbi:MAG: hypothetical protein KatS3mg084_0395 [Candidatus Dojkabacteria bacterium]|nr:MAG: hypothetical protein KatS3mg084_0395 [Candidatus Dojkabacteria bacterium]
MPKIRNVGTKTIERDGKTVGRVDYYESAGQEGTCICNLYVEEAYRRQGIGSALVEEVLRDSKTQPPFFAYIRANRRGVLNQGSYQLFLKLGFKPINKLGLQIGDDGERYKVMEETQSYKISKIIL